jgi:N-acylneuraminate cytidylyltransferase
MDKKKLKVYGFIFARGGSKGVKNKNIRVIAGKPLIAHAIDAALKTRLVERVIVSTDSELIAETAIDAGAEVPFLRPDFLASDTSPEWLSWQHAVKFFMDTGHNFDIFVSIPATSPLRKPEDIDRCINALADDENADGVISVCPSVRHPAFNMVVLDQRGYASVAAPAERNIARRQDVPKMYDITTVAYAAKPEFILKASSFMEGRIRTIEVPQQRALDIDSEFDLKLAELIIKSGLLKE